MTSPSGPDETPDPTATAGTGPSTAVVGAAAADGKPDGEVGASAAAEKGDGEAADGGAAAEGDGPMPVDRRKRLIIVGAAVVGALLVVLVVLLLTQGSGTRDPMTVVTITEQATVPTPQTDPIERDTSTELLAALPDTVLGWAVSEQAESDIMLDAHALEGWSLTYADPDSAVVMKVGQWPDGKEALAAYESLLGDADSISSGEVVVGEDKVGEVVTQKVDDDTERTIWRNRTAVFLAEGPTGSTQDFFDAYPF